MFFFWGGDAAPTQHCSTGVVKLSNGAMLSRYRPLSNEMHVKVKQITSIGNEMHVIVKQITSIGNEMHVIVKQITSIGNEMHVIEMQCGQRF